MNKSLRQLVALFIVLGWNASVGAQQVGLMPIPVLQNVQVQGQASFDAGSGLYTYSYTITNPATNTGRIDRIDIDISQPFRERVFSSEGLTIPFGVNTLTFDDVLAMRRNPDPMIPVGMRVPTGWRGGLGPTGFAFFGSSGPELGTDEVIPGETQAGFEVISRGMPTLRQMKLVPDWVFLVPTEEAATPEIKQQAREIRASLPIRTRTLGPSASSPGSFGHWNQLRDDLNQAIQLSWIPDQALATTLVAQLTDARQALDAGDGTLAKARLQTLIQTIAPSTDAQRRREVADLLVLNAQRMIEATPDTPVPFEPKVTPAPRKSSLPIGTPYTLTATVVNLGDPHQVPVVGFDLAFQVLEGPNQGLEFIGRTDQQGQLRFSYTGTQLGTDRILVGVIGEAFLEVDSAEVTWSGGPDLVVPLFVPPLLKSEGGKTIFITEWTSNLGSVAALPSTTRYFLSADPVIDPGTAQVIGQRAIPALAPGERSEGGTVTFTLPSDLPAGVYHLAACADAGTAVAELNEDNNCSFSKLEGQTSIVVALEREAGTNQPPLAQAGPDQTIECRSPTGATVTLDGSASSDPDSDPLTFRWTDSFGTVQGPTPDVILPLGAHIVTLTVDDGQGNSASDPVAITVVDRQPPMVTAALTRLASEKKSDKPRGQRGKEEDEEDRRERDSENQFRVVAQATDHCDLHPSVQAAINGVPVSDGEVVRLERDDDDKKVRRKKGVLNIQAPNIVLTVSATDASGNRDTAKAKLGKKRHEHDD